ncbi:MAG: ATP synthase F1 subunit epsilon [Bacteroidales bacterium]|nr:ATP synthase F1 subunit epsilon [Bacteroidales bacterium]MDD4684493.1 ATP synthase F1 subunit epsilon [Bacteroidales bacterium]
MKVNIISPEKLVYQGEVTLLQLPGIDGSFQILNNHASIISVLAKGKIRLVTKDEELFIPINSGVIECSNNNIQILVQ